MAASFQSAASTKITPPYLCQGTGCVVIPFTKGKLYKWIDIVTIASVIYLIKCYIALFPRLHSTRSKRQCSLASLQKNWSLNPHWSPMNSSAQCPPNNITRSARTLARFKFNGYLLGLFSRWIFPYRNICLLCLMGPILCLIANTDSLQKHEWHVTYSTQNFQYRNPLWEQGLEVISQLKKTLIATSSFLFNNLKS